MPIISKGGALYSPASEVAPALSPAHCPLCAFQSAFWQPALQYAATAHMEHFFSGMPVAQHDQQLFLGRGGRSCCRCCGGAAGCEAAAAAVEGGPTADGGWNEAADEE